MKILISKLLAVLWNVIDIILFLAACVSFTYGAFLINQVVGLIVLGVIFIISAFLTEIIPQTKKGSDK